VAIAPRNVIEEGLVHRIAVCLWRLQRAAKVDSAVSSIAVVGVQPNRERVQYWIDQILRGWRVEMVEERDPEVIRAKRESGRLLPGRKCWRRCRPHLCTMDVYRQDTMMRNGSAITAMTFLLHQLGSRLECNPFGFNPDQAEQLAWLLGEEARRYPADEHFAYPDENKRCSSIEQMIGEARKREAGTPLPEPLMTTIVNRVSALQAMRQMCEEPYTVEADEHAKLAALLPDAAMMDRILRYETHADRSLHRALETLAKMRGATVEKIAATLTNSTTNGSTLELHGERTRWISPNGPH